MIEECNFKVSLVIVFIWVVGLSCGSDDDVTPYTAEYWEMVSNIDLDCDEGTTNFVVSGILRGEEFCHHSGMEGREIMFLDRWRRLSSGTELNFNSQGTIIDDSLGEKTLHFYPDLAIVDYQQRELPYVLFEFPTRRESAGMVEKLDSFLSITDHQIMGAEDVVIPEWFDISQEALFRNSGGFREKIVVSLRTRGEQQGSNLDRTIAISSLYGDQSDSFLRILKAEKIEQGGFIVYDLEFEFECTLYHLDQYGPTEPYGRLEDGYLNVRFVVNF